MKLAEWDLKGKVNGWWMPKAPAWKRAPIIRHLRATTRFFQLFHDHDFWTRAGATYGLLSYEHWVILGIWYGQERPQ